MANRWITNGASCITAPTLGDLTDKRVVISRYVYIDFSVVTSGYIDSQASSSSSLREYGQYLLGGDLSVVASGDDNEIGLISDIFPTIAEGTLTTDTDYQAETYDILLNGVSLIGGPQAITVGVSRSDTCLLRFGARAGSNPGSDPASNSFIISAGAKFGDIHVEVYDSLGALDEERRYEMPTSGTTVTDSISGQDGTLQAGTGGGADWETVDSVVAPDVGFGLYSLAPESLASVAVEFTGAYADMAPASVEYVVLQSAVPITASIPVDSFAGGVYFADVTIAPGENYTIEVTANDGVSDHVDTSEEFAVTAGLAFTGSSSGAFLAIQDTGTLDVGAVMYFRQVDSATVTRFTNADGAIAGAGRVEIANMFYRETGLPVSIYMHAEGGTEISDDWNATAPRHLKILSQLSRSKATAIIDMVGLNDAYALITIAAQTIEDMYSSYRDNLGALVISGSSQRNGRLDRTQYFVALFEAYDSAYTNLAAFVKPFYRIDLGISADDLHLTPADSLVAAQRAAQTALYSLGAVSYGNGPKISNPTYTDTTVRVNLNRAGSSYTSISPLTGLAGFQFEDDTGIFAGVTADVISASRLDAELGRAVVGDLYIRFAAYDDNVPGLGVLPFTDYPVVDSVIPFPVSPLFADMLVNQPAEGSFFRKGSISLSLGFKLTSLWSSFSIVAPTFADYSSDYSNLDYSEA